VRLVLPTTCNAGRTGTYPIRREISSAAPITRDANSGDPLSMISGLEPEALHAPRTPVRVKDRHGDTIGAQLVLAPVDCITPPPDLRQLTHEDPHARDGGRGKGGQSLLRHNPPGLLRGQESQNRLTDPGAVQKKPFPHQCSCPQTLGRFDGVYGEIAIAPAALAFRA
jgi:hypothetical protein